MRLQLPTIAAERNALYAISSHIFIHTADMTHSLPSFQLKFAWMILLISLAVSGCATRGVTHNNAAYKECVLTQAMDMFDSPSSAEDLAKLAAAQCQGNLGIITDKLRQDNAWMERYGSNADAYTEKLRDRTIADVADEIRKVRGK